MTLGAGMLADMILGLPVLAICAWLLISEARYQRRRLHEFDRLCNCILASLQEASQQTVIASLRDSASIVAYQPSSPGPSHDLLTMESHDIDAWLAQEERSHQETAGEAPCGRSCNLEPRGASGP